MRYLEKQGLGQEHRRQQGKTGVILSGAGRQVKEKPGPNGPITAGIKYSELLGRRARSL